MTKNKIALFVTIVVLLIGVAWLFLSEREQKNVSEATPVIDNNMVDVSVKIIVKSTERFSDARLTVWTHQGVRIGSQKINELTRMAYGVDTLFSINKQTKAVWALLNGSDQYGKQIICLSHYTVDEIIKHINFTCDGNETLKNRLVLSEMRFLTGNVDPRAMIVAYGFDFIDLDASTKKWLSIEACLYNDLVDYVDLKYNTEDPLDYDDMWLQLGNETVELIRKNSSIEFDQWISALGKVFPTTHAIRFEKFIKERKHDDDCQLFIEKEKLTFSPPVMTTAKKGYGYLFWPPYIAASHYRIESEEGLFVVGDLPIIKLDSEMLDVKAFDIAFRINEPMTKVHKLVAGSDE